MVIVDVAVVVERVDVMVTSVEMATVGVGRISDAEMKSTGGEV
jgi:hypothetical protein